MSEPVDGTLLRWAQSVADGTPLVEQAERQSDAGSDPCLKRFQILASIASLCGMPVDHPGPARDVLFRWGHLEICEKIGEGVYGEVFRAWDTALEREVAVKFLRSEASPVAALVLREGRHLAKIGYPGVVTVYGAQQLDGRVGIWMEYVRGRTLEDVLQQGGPFSPEEALQIGIDLCRALAAVHRAGLVHRDVKTRNVVREDTGRVVLMDLGAGVDARSETGMGHGLAGTPIYLAPEVLRGEPASPRSDLYSLGVLLYRLATHGYPITGNDLETLSDAHARGDLRPLREARTGLPARFVRVVERALAPDPARRFASAERMEVALVEARDAPRREARRRAFFATVAAVVVLATGLAFTMQRLRKPIARAPSERPPIAVADVVNEIRDPELDGLAGMLVTSLEQSPSLAVMTRSRLTDILAQTGKPTDGRIDRALGLEICRRVDAAALLLLSVHPMGDGYRIDLDAVEPRHGRRLFVASGGATSKEQIPSVIDALSRRARAELSEGGTPTRTTLRSVADISTANLSAYRHYDRAERLIDRLDMAQARGELERAVALDSTFALAHGRLAYVYWWLNDSERQRDALARAFAMIDRVPERERYHLRAQRALAGRQGLEAARSILLEMERFYPHDKEMLYDIGDYSSHLNEFPTAFQYLERVVAMDPSFARALQHMARVYRDMGNREAFLEWAKRYAAADSAWDSYVLLGNAQIAAGDAANGIETLRRGRERALDHAQDFIFFTANARFYQGRIADGLREWDRLLGTASTLALRGAHLRGRAAGRIHQGAYRDARADLGRAIELAGDHNPVQEAMTRMDAASLLMVGFGDRLAAFRQVERCAALEPSITYLETYFNYWEYWGGLFKLYLLDGNHAAATVLAKQKFAPDKWYDPYVASYLHAAKGGCAQAAAAASQVLEWGPAAENIPLLYFLGRCQSEAGQLDEAVASLDRLQTLYSHMTLGTPYYAKSLLLLGQVHERRGDLRSAARSFSKLLDLWRSGDHDHPDAVAARRQLERLEPMLASGPRRRPSHPPDPTGALGARRAGAGVGP